MSYIGQFDGVHVFVVLAAMIETFKDPRGALVALTLSSHNLPIDRARELFKPCRHLGSLLVSMENVPFYGNSQNMCFVGRNSQVYCDYLQNNLPADFQNRALPCKEALPWSLRKPQIMTYFT